MEEAQKAILKKFFFNKHLRFSELSVELPSNKLSYYLNKLTLEGLLEKSGGHYTITTKGEEKLTYLNKELDELKQPVQSILLFPTKGKKYLLQRRAKQPFFKVLGPIGTKRVIGENITETAGRKLLEDTGLLGKFELKGFLDAKTFKDDKLYLHYLFAMVKVTKTKGELKSKTAKGENYWITKNEFYKSKNITTGMKYHFGIVESKKFCFTEINQYLDKSGKFMRAELIKSLP